MIEIWDKLPVDDRIRLTMVSRRFRNVALASSKLWRYIKFVWNTPIMKLRELLSRAEDANLHLSGTSDGFDRYPHRYPDLERAYEIELTTPNKTNTPTRANLIEERLPQCAVLDARVDLRDIRRSSVRDRDFLSLSSLQTQMPVLRSLCLVPSAINGLDLTQDSGLHEHLPVPFPLFSAHTPNLRHVHLVSLSPRWDDPLFHNLTYLRLDYPSTAATVLQLLSLAKACPMLEYLILNHAIHANSVALETSPIICLPRLRHLFVKQRESGPLISLLNKLEVPAGPYLSLWTSDCLPLIQHDLRMGSPWSQFSQPDELIISGSGFKQSLFSVVCKHAGNIVVAFHLSMESTRQLYTHILNDGQYQIIPSLSQSAIPRERIKTLTLEASFSSVEFIQQLLNLFPMIETLRTVTLNVNGSVALPMPANNALPTPPTIMEILGNDCPNLRELDIGPVPPCVPATLLTWLKHRHSSCLPLKHVSVYADAPLSRPMRQKFADVLDTIIWRRSWGVAGSPNPLGPPFHMLLSLQSFLHPAQTSIPSKVEQSGGDAFWDEEVILAEPEKRKRTAYITDSDIEFEEDMLPDYFSFP
jgi:hypothetical protein